jgi:nitroimidazol reductase NimA-like FMN-containing flavoprotein (pyridoxamine 5'-phosphate oxidase superfamily)
MTSFGLVHLSPDECRALLPTQTIGRVGVVFGTEQAILPVNYVVIDGDVYFRTDPGSKLIAAVLHRPVVFEIDHAEPGTRDGWSVNVVGHAEEVTDRALRQRVLDGPLEPWAEGVRDNVVRIRAEELTGRRIQHKG